MKRIKLRDVPSLNPSLTPYTYKESLIYTIGFALFWAIFALGVNRTYYLLGFLLILVFGLIVQIAHFLNYSSTRKVLELKAERELNQLFNCDECGKVYRRYEIDNLDIVLKHRAHTSNFKCRCKHCGSNVSLMSYNNPLAESIHQFDLIPYVTYEEALVGDMYVDPLIDDTATKEMLSIAIDLCEIRQSQS